MVARADGRSPLLRQPPHTSVVALLGMPVPLLLAAASLLLAVVTTTLASPAFYVNLTNISTPPAVSDYYALIKTSTHPPSLSATRFLSLFIQ